MAERDQAATSRFLSARNRLFTSKPEFFLRGGPHD